MLFESVIVFLATVCSIVESQSGSGTCANLATNCDANLSLCTNNIYRGLMAQQCMVTCGLCSNGNCKDVNSNCPVWKQNGFCDSPFYDESVKQQYCQLSCNINCGGASGAG